MKNCFKILSQYKKAGITCFFILKMKINLNYLKFYVLYMDARIILL